MTVLARSVSYGWATQDDPLAWMDAAACAGAPVDVFFPGNGGSYLTAKAICERCPVLEPCRDAIDRAERTLAAVDIQGMYAGETPAERRRRRKATLAEEGLRAVAPSRTHLDRPRRIAR
jgi:hypothetical protein